jgi:hypothetical protein
MPVEAGSEILNTEALSKMARGSGSAGKVILVPDTRLVECVSF